MTNEAYQDPQSGSFDTSELDPPLQGIDLAPYWLAAIIKSADDAIVGKTLEGIITSWNPGAERIFGYTASEVIGKSVTILIPRGRENEETQILSRIRVGEHVEHYETVRRRKDGTLVDISLTVSPIRGPGNRIVGASKIARDISMRKASEAGLRAALEEAHAAREETEIINRVGQVLTEALDLNKVAQAITDAATELTGARFGSFFYNVGNETGGSYMLYAISGMTRDAFSHFPTLRTAELFGPTFHRIGPIRIANVKLDPRFCDTSPYYGMSDQELRVVSYLAVPVVSRTGDVLGGLFFGHPEEEQFTERHERIVTNLAAQTAIAMDNSTLYETVQRDRATAEESAREIERLYQDTKEANRLKDEFLAALSHELRTPLTAILGWTHVLRSDTGVDAKAARAIETIERNARAQAQLIDDLLDVSRIITGKLRLDVRPVDPVSIIELAIESLRPAAESKRLRLQKVIENGVGVVMVDPVRLQQVMWNLLSNAIKFTPTEGTVVVKLQHTSSQVEIVVSDSGQGIATDFLPFVFERFRQADQKTTRRHGGLGLGLAIVRHLVELHGGTVRAESEGDDQGATFTIQLPLTAMPPVETLYRPMGSVARDPLFKLECADRLDGLKVLVVDDERDTREMLKAGLAQCGATVSAAESVRSGLDELGKEKFDVLISDIAMPDLDGYEFVKRVRALPAEKGGRVPAIALTAYTRTEDRLHVLRSGYQMHIPKPVELAELVAVVASLARR